jgi:hypothetical protein
MFGSTKCIDCDAPEINVNGGAGVERISPNRLRVTYFRQRRVNVSPSCTSFGTGMNGWRRGRCSTAPGRPSPPRTSTPRPRDEAQKGDELTSSFLAALQARRQVGSPPVGTAQTSLAGGHQSPASGGPLRPPPVRARRSGPTT